jgi:uncharacterized delta-60 repeat protein
LRSLALAIVLVTASGAIDPTFGHGGKVGAPVASRQIAHALSVQAGGKLVVAGATSGSGSGSALVRFGFGLTRYGASGALDTSFGAAHTGTVRTLVGPKGDEAYALVVQPDGKLVAAGLSRRTRTSVDIAVIRYTAKGALDTSFGAAHSGIVRTTVGPSSRAFALALQPDGKILAAGSTFNGTNTDFVIVRYTAGGSLDPTFGTGGVVTTSLASGGDTAFAIAVQPDGKIVAAGSTSTAAHIGHDDDIGLARYNTDGSLDTSFGVGGKTRTALGSSDDAARALAIQPDGRLVIAGYSVTGGRVGSVLVRYMSNGTLDSSFGAGGKVLPGALAGYRGDGLVLQPDGKLATANSAPGPNPPKSRFAVARYLSNGSPDPSFGVNGRTITATAGLASDAAALVRQADGKLVIAGTVVTNGKPEYQVLFRYTP